MAKHKKHHRDDDDDDINNGEDKHYKKTLRALQIELVKLQRDLIADNAKVLMILEGRDAAGKDGAIKRITHHMSPRETRVHAPGKPSNTQETQWYFQRFVPFLPSGGEFVIFNRSWYNRSGVEQVMGFCDKAQLHAFYESVIPFENMLVRDGIQIRKYYLDISRDEQKTRLAEREEDPLTQWKISPVDAKAQKMWDQYSKARDETFRRTDHPAAPWRIVQTDTKKIARLEIIRDLVSSFDYTGKDKRLARPDRDIVFFYTPDTKKRLYR
ncbi:MAG: polyphosphate kinase 2 [Proteobacteria bacterium]|nr:polyphosphate kinase 2 [Pseudomonadota bacterium]